MADNNKPENSRSPCASCTSVKVPGSCDKKYCKRWSAWFVERWNYWTALLRPHLKEGGVESGEES